VLLIVLMSGAKGGATAARSDAALTVFAQNSFMSDEYRLTFRQSDHARPDFAAIESNLQFIVAQLARLPDRAYVSRLMVLVTVELSALIVAVALLLWSTIRPIR